MKKRLAASHKDVSGFALLPSFLAGAITGLCGLGLCSVITTKYLKEELKNPVNLSFSNVLTLPELEFARDSSTEKEIIFDQLVVKKYQYRKFVTNNRRVPGAPLAPIVVRRAAPIMARRIKPISKPVRKILQKIELDQVVNKAIEVPVAHVVSASKRLEVANPRKLEVYSAIESEPVVEQNIPEAVIAPSAEDEYSKMRSLRNTFVASLIGEMSDMTTQGEHIDLNFPEETQPESVPVINEVFKEKISLPKAHPVAKRKQVISKPVQIVKKVVRRRIVKAPVRIVEPAKKIVEEKKVEIAQTVAIQPNESEKLLQTIETHLKQEVKKIEYSQQEPVNTQVKEEVEVPVVPLAKVEVAPVKMEAPVAVSARVAKILEKKIEVKEDVPVVIDSPRVEVTQEYTAPAIPVVQAAPEFIAEPAPQAQQAPVTVSLPVSEPKKEAEPVVVARAWTLAPPVITKTVIAPAEPLIVTIKPNNPPAQPVNPEPKKESGLPLDPIGNIASLLKTDEPVVQPEPEVVAVVAREPEPLPPAPLAPIKSEKLCTHAVCFDRWLSKNNEQLDVLTYSLNKIPTPPNAKEWLLTNEERSVPTLYFGANLGNIPLINKSELEQTVKNIEGEGFLLIRGNPSWTLVGSASLLEENTISNSERAPGDKLYTKVQPGMLLVKVKHKETMKLASVAIPIMRGHISFLDLSQSVERTAEVSLEKPLPQLLGIEWIGTEVLSAIKAGQTENKVKLQTFGNYPLNVDVRSLDGFSHRHLVFPDNGKINLKVDILKDKQVERFLKMLEGGVSSDSAMVYGKIPLKYIGNNVRLDPGRVSRKLIPELYFFDGNLNEEDQILIPTAQASVKTRNMVGVQVPKGLLLISLEKSSGDRHAVQLHLAQPGVINVYQPE